MRLAGLMTAVVMLITTGTSSATIPASLPGACVDRSAAPAAYVFCDDGLPDAGGRTPNLDGALAVTVPARYDTDSTPGNDPAAEYVGLPPMAGDAATMPGAAPLGAEAGTIAIDLDVSYPTAAPPAGGHPLIVYTHGCCSGTKTSWESDELEPDGQRWHYNNAWFASRGYVVINMTVRGFTSTLGGSPRGSTGESGLMSRSLEINDFQHIACQLHADMEAGVWDNLAGTQAAPRINPEKVVVTGGSYAGGFSFLAFTDPIWTCNAETGADGTRMKLVAAAPMYTWTDLVQSLVPTGTHFVEPGGPLPSFDGCDSGPRAVAADGSYSDCGPDVVNSHPVGIPKATIVAGLFGTGAGATFPPKLNDTFACIGQGNTYPPEGTPACLGASDPINQVLPEFVRDRSPYYQQRFFDLIATDPEYRIPLMSMVATTDNLFPMPEHRRMHARLLSVVPDYPLQAYFGDYQHFNQNKDKEWNDLCGDDHHICKIDDYPGGDFNAVPTNRRRQGVISRINAFLDHYAQPVGNPSQPAPPREVTAAVQVCPKNATARWPADEPGERFTAPDFESITDTTIEFSVGGGTLTAVAVDTTNEVSGNAHALEADPIADGGSGAMDGCHLATGPAEPGIAVFETAPLVEEVLIAGASVLDLSFAPNLALDTASFQMNTRLYDVFPDGTALLVDRGPRRVSTEEATSQEPVSIALHGNVYRFVAGNRIRLEVFQDEDPGYLKDSDPPSAASITDLSLRMPRRSNPVPIPVSVLDVPAEVQSSGRAGEMVPAGEFTLTNNSGQDHELSSLFVFTDNPDIFAGFRATAGGATGAVGDTGEGFFVVFFPGGVSIARDTTLVVSLEAELAGGAARASLFQTAYAHHGGVHAAHYLWWLAAILAAALLSLSGRRQAAALAFAVLFVAGCTSEPVSGDLTPSPGGVVPGSSLVTLGAAIVEGADDGAQISYDNVPAVLGRVTLAN